MYAACSEMFEHKTLLYSWINVKKFGTLVFIFFINVAASDAVSHLSILPICIKRSHYLFSNQRQKLEASYNKVVPVYLFLCFICETLHRYACNFFFGITLKSSSANLILFQVCAKELLFYMMSNRTLLILLRNNAFGIPSWALPVDCFCLFWQLQST